MRNGCTQNRKACSLNFWCRLWRFTALYFNPSDPALFVPARYGYGLTLNFGRPAAIAIMVAILLAGLGGPFLLARALLR